MSGRAGLGRFEAEPVALLAFMAIGLMYPIYRGIGAVAVAAAVLLVVAAASRWMSDGRSIGLLPVAGVAIGLGLLVFRLFLRAIPTFEWGVPQPLWGEIVYVAGAAAVGIAVLVVRRRGSSGMAPIWFGWAGAAILAGVLVILCANVLLHSKPLVDVIIGHEAAADAVIDGRDPYGDLVFQDTSPLAEPGDVITGYVYPPSALVTYGGTYLLVGDARWATLAAYVAFVIILMQPWVARSWDAVLISTASALMFVSIPYLDLVAYIGWTDPIALPLVLLAVRFWSRRPVLAAILLGLALSTKQYFIVVAPLLLLLSDARRWQRVLIAGATVLVTYLPFLAMGTSVVLGPLEQLSGQPYRPDSLGLPNLKVNLPRFVSLLVGFVVAAFAGLRGGSAARIALGMAAALAGMFVTGNQSFVNYWVVVAGIIIVALESRGGDVTSEGRSSASPANVGAVSGGSADSAR